MSTVIEFWKVDGSGEALIRDQRVKIMDALSQAATCRPLDCVLVTLRDTRPHIMEEIVLWKKEGYVSTCVTSQEMGLLNTWKDKI